HHPHVIEPAEIIEDTVVFYSLGNFIFDQETKETNEGYAVEERVVTDEETGELLSRELTVHPYNIQGYRPTLLEGEEKYEMCERVLGLLEGTFVNGCVLTLRQ